MKAKMVITQSILSTTFVTYLHKKKYLLEIVHQNIPIDMHLPNSNWHKQSRRLEIEAGYER